MIKNYIKTIVISLWVASCTVTDDRIDLSVITINSHPAATVNVTEGNITGSLSVNANVSGGATLSYQWYSNTTNSYTGGVSISGAKYAYYAIPATLAAGTYYYFCELSATGGAELKRSDVARVNVANRPAINIHTQPAATTNFIAGGITGSLIVGASVSGGATLSYQWYCNTSYSNVGGSSISGATNASYTIPATLAAGTYYYFCEVSAFRGAESKRSDVSTVSVQNSPSGITIDMVYVQGGTFQMGSPEGVGYDGERPQHSVTLNDFLIDKYQVTVGLWKAVMGSDPSYFKKGDNYPVESVSWDDIVGTSSSAVGYTVNGITYYQNGFCFKLSQMVGGVRQYRLPTEAEWEFAARGGNQSRGYEYSGSYRIGDVAWYSVNSSSSTQPVGTKSANELGIFDMSGNVWEWCGDWYDSYNNLARNNPTGPTSGYNRVERGGSWHYDAAHARVARREGNATGARSNQLGFRLVTSSN